MTSLIAVLGFIIAAGAAVRSTWSPCGLSMLSTITPVGERGRGNRYRTTAAWFIIGATAGGVTLGGLGAVLAAAVAVLRVPAGARLSILAAASLIAAAADIGVGVQFPVIRRQVNERWLDQFRGWCYGVGFGWQVGVGLATYVMTAAVFLLVLVAALTASPLMAFGLGLAFGLIRGAAVLLSRRLTTPAELRAFHQRFDALGGPVRLAVIGLEVAVAQMASAAAWPPLAAVVAAAVLAAGLGAVRIRHRTVRAM